MTDEFAPRQLGPRVSSMPPRSGHSCWRWFMRMRTQTLLCFPS